MSVQYSENDKQQQTRHKDHSVVVTCNSMLCSSTALLDSFEYRYNIIFLNFKSSNYQTWLKVMNDNLIIQSSFNILFGSISIVCSFTCAQFISMFQLSHRLLQCCCSNEATVV